MVVDRRLVGCRQPRQGRYIRRLCRCRPRVSDLLPDARHHQVDKDVVMLGWLQVAEAPAHLVADKRRAGRGIPPARGRGEAHVLRRGGVGQAHRDLRAADAVAPAGTGLEYIGKGAERIIGVLGRRDHIADIDEYVLAGREVQIEAQPLDGRLVGALRVRTGDHRRGNGQPADLHGELLHLRVAPSAIAPATRVAAWEARLHVFIDIAEVTHGESAVYLRLHRRHIGRRLILGDRLHVDHDPLGQHAYLRYPAGADVAAGQVLGRGHVGPRHANPAEGDQPDAAQAQP